MRRIAPIVLITTLAVVGCGDALTGVGDFSERFVHGDTSSTTTTTVPEGPVVALSPVTDATWMNEGLDAGVGRVEADVLIARIWDRSPKTSEFVQAAPLEIVATLPGLKFPRLLPAGVTHISSQLVYDRQTLTLDPASSAAFGMWTAAPYTVPRGEGQSAVLRVGRNQVPGTGEGDISTFRVADGREMSWIEGDYVYSLFCRTGVSEEACFAIAESTVTLSLLTLRTG